MQHKLMRALKRVLRTGSLPLVLFGSGSLTGCAMLKAESTKPPITVSEVVQLSEEGVLPEAILDRMRETKTVYRLSAAQLAQLHDRGVADPVLNYMQQTYLESVREEQSRMDWNDWMMWGDHWW
jgi:hypothetical protein